MNQEVKITVKIDVAGNIVDQLSEEDKKNLVYNVFNTLQDVDKMNIFCDLFSDMEEKTQNLALDDIISQQLSDEQFHILTEYFKKYGK